MFALGDKGWCNNGIVASPFDMNPFQNMRFAFAHHAVPGTPSECASTPTVQADAADIGNQKDGRPEGSKSHQENNLQGQPVQTALRLHRFSERLCPRLAAGCAE